MQRAEHDFIGTMAIPEDALYGIHAIRAFENFPFKDAFDKDWYAGVGVVKLACYKTYIQFHDAIIAKYADKSPLPLIDKSIVNTLIKAAEEVSEQTHFEWFIVPSTQGGAGKSINMNTNEIITNRALLMMCKKQ